MTSYFWILTLAKPAPGRGIMQITISNTYDARDDQTRGEIYSDIRDYAHTEYPNVADGNVLFFSLEPNQLPTA